jgi:eukaryotic-like serine/threonine-protein kinase
MSITAPMVLPPDLLIISGRDLTSEMLARCTCSEKDFVVTRPRSRAQSKVVNGELAELLQFFREPKTIVEVVLSQCSAQGTEPEHTLEKMFWALEPFIQARWLVPAKSEEAREIEASLRPGETVDGYTIVGCRHLLEDTEVYQARGPDNTVAALKIARRGAPPSLRRVFENEAAILERLDGMSAPRLLGTGNVEGQSYLVMTWSSGVVVTQAAAELRLLHANAGRLPLLNLCRSVLRAYAALHTKGVVHGDVYPKNILVDATGGVSLVDFGLGHSLARGDSSELPRRGVPDFFEPELAAAALRGCDTPVPSVAGEQYALAALMYLLITGEPYLTFSGVREAMLRQIVEESPLTFSSRGFKAWPGVEEVLATALSKSAERRFPSVSDFEIALGRVSVQDLVPLTRVGNSLRRQRGEGLIVRLDCHDIPTLPLPTGAPHCSLTYGATGVGLALYAAACARGSASLLSAADAWLQRARRAIHRPDAFTSDSLGVDNNTANVSSLYYGECGVYFVQALIAHGMGDEVSTADAVERYVRACHSSELRLDLTTGLAGVLVGCALLVDAIKPAVAGERQVKSMAQLFELGRSANATIADALGRKEEEMLDGYLGIAHGWAGLCYAALLWAEVRREPPSPAVHRKLEELVGYAESHGRGVRWPTRKIREGNSVHPSYMESWCHGSAGYVHLLTAAFRAYGEHQFCQLAERAGWSAWEAEPSLGSLCCGDVGRAYSLLDLFRHSGDEAWAVRAGALAQRAVEKCETDSRMTYSLFKGSLGAAVLMEDLEQPALASVPSFQRDLRTPMGVSKHRMLPTAVQHE